MTEEVRFEHQNAFQKFAWRVQTRARFIQEEESSRFLRAVLATSCTRVDVLTEGASLWRARLGAGEGKDHFGGDEPEIFMEFDVPLEFEEMKPTAKVSKDGRVNCHGIPCLYMAKNPKTAIAECRPWNGALISVATMRLAKDCKVVDFSRDDKGMTTLSPLGEVSAAECEAWVWHFMGRAFTRPVSPDESRLDYLPTQIIAEYLRLNGFDGIVYRSALGDTSNVALFDLQSAEVQDCELFEIEHVDYKPKPHGHKRY